MVGERSTGPGTDAEPRWHQALGYAVLGEILPELGHQVRMDVAELSSHLERLVPGGIQDLRNTVRDRRTAGQEWPYRVPPELMREIGYAQFAAALTMLCDRLEVMLADPPAALADRALTAEERRLGDEVPPHHGS